MEESVVLPDNTKQASSSEAKKRETSDVWTYFTKKGMGTDGIGRAECIGCKKIFKSGGKLYGTSTLWRHTKSCKKIKFHDVGQMLVDCEGKLMSRKIDPKVARGLLAAAVIKHDLAFSLVEYSGFRTYIKYLNPDAPSISRNTLVSDITKMYVCEKEKLKQILAGIRNRICLTSDCWTACTSEGYICLTAHFVDRDWKLKSKLLNFTHMPPPHSGVELARKLFGFLKEWGIEKKIFSLTLDNASSNDNMQDILKRQLSMHDSLLCDGDFFHIRCSAHILNLIVQEGLKVANDALVKIRDSVKYVRGSESRMRKFEECVKEVGNIDTSIGLRLDVSTRWNSTYLMLNSVIRYKKVFTSLQLVDKNYKYCPSSLEWSRAEKIYEFLEPFYDTTNLISGTSYPTSNLYFMQVWKIERLLQENKINNDEVIRNMCCAMWNRFEKYWSEYSITLAFGVVLDPRYKLSMLKYFYSKVEMDEAKVEEKVSLVKTKLYKLFEHYNVGNMSSSSQDPSSTNLGSILDVRKCGDKRMYDEIEEYESQTITSTGKSELELYLEEPKLLIKFNPKLDVLQHWKDNHHRFPSVALMACDVLAIPITTVASESSFSIGSRILTKYRSSMLPEKVQTLICTRNWLHGFSRDIEEEVASNKSTISDVASNSNPVTIDEDEDVEENEDEDDVEDILEMSNAYHLIDDFNI